MELENIFLNLINEQPEIDGLETNNDLDLPTSKDGDIDPEIKKEPIITPVNPKPQKPLSPIQLLKQKWSQENPNINDDVMSKFIDLFNQRKNGFRPFIENPENGYTNLPEIVALKYKFPNFPAENIQKLKDITQYTWGQIEFLMDRIGTRIENETTNDYSFLETKEQIDKFKINYFRNAIKQWNKTEGRIIDEQTIRVYRVESRNESIALGILQHIYKDKLFPNEGSYWCITNGEWNSGANMYDSYRRNMGRSNYFVMNKANRTTDPSHFINCIQAVKTQPGMYNLVKLENNGDNIMKWSEIVKFHPQLASKEHLFVNFPLTKKELTDLTLDKITFNNNPDEPSDFLNLTLDKRLEFIRSGRLIHNLYAYNVLQDNEVKNYIANMTILDFKTRFLSNNKHKPFEIFDYIKNKRKKDLYNYMDVKAKEIGLPNGVSSIKTGMISPNFTSKMIDKKNPNLILMVNKMAGNVGVFDKSIQDFKIPPVFTKIKELEFYRDVYNERLQVNKRYFFMVTRYDVSEEFINLYEANVDISSFFTVFPTRNLDKTGEYKLIGNIILDKTQGDALLNAARKLNP